MDFKEFIYANKLKQVDLANYLNIKEASVSRWCKGVSKPSDDNLRKIIENPYGWNTSCLIGNTTAIAKNNSTITIGSNNQFYESKESKEDIKDKREENLIPLFPIDAAAGFLGGDAEQVMPYQCEMVSCPVSGATCAIRVSGDSMTPRFPSGSIVYLRKVNTFIEYGRVYVLDTTDGAVLKEIHHNEDEDFLTCVSLNENPKFHPYVIPKNCINGTYKVLGTLILE